MLAHQFPRRDEFTQLLNEMKSQCEDNNRRFENVEWHIEIIQDELTQYCDDIGFQKNVTF